MQLVLMLTLLSVIRDDQLLHRKIFQDPMNLHGKTFYNKKIVPKETEGNIFLK